MRLIAAIILTLIATIPAYAVDTVQVDRDGITTTAVHGSAAAHATEDFATAAQGANARKGATYTILPYGDTRQADYYCTATDCGATFQTVFDAIKASGKGGNIKVLEGTYPFTTSVLATDADSVSVEGVTPVGMWAVGGSIFLRNANVTLFNFTKSVNDPNACDISRIHFKDGNTGYTAPVLKYVNAHNMGQFRNYFDVVPQAIYADRPWDFWTSENNFRNCGTGDTKDTACIGIYNGATDQGSGWMITNNRFETRPGTSIYSDASGASGGTPDGANTINISFNKFEGADNSAYPAVHGVFWSSRFIGNSVFKADTAKPAFWLVNANGAYSGGNVIAGNTMHAHKGYAVSVAGDGNVIAENAFFTQDAPAAHIRIDQGTNNGVGVNTQTDAITMLSDAGTGTKSVKAAAYLTASGNGTSAATVSGTLTVGKQTTFDANGNVIASAYDVGSTGGGGSGTVSSGTAGQFGYYQNNGTTVTGKTLAESDVSGLVTDLAAKQTALTDSASLAGSISDETGTGKAVFSDSPQMTGTPAVKSTAGSNLAPDGDFATDPSGIWVGTNWSWAAGKMTHTAGSTANLATTLASYTSGTTYKITYDISGMSTGSILAYFGGVNNPPAFTNGTVTQYVTATSTGNSLGFTPSSNFDGSVDNLVVTAMSGGNATIGDNFSVANDGSLFTIGASTIDGIKGTALLVADGLGSGITARSYKDDATTRTSFTLSKYRGSVATPLTVQSGDKLGTFAMGGYDGTALQTGATIDAYVDGTVTSGNVPTRWEFVTGSNLGGRLKRFAISSGGMITEGLDDKTAAFTVANSTSRITLASGTATVTLPKTLPAGTTSVLITVAGAADSGVSFAAESGGSLSWGDAGAPTFANNKTRDVVCVSENASATTTAAWRCTAGGNF